jgi:hypothetical protein
MARTNQMLRDDQSGITVHTGFTSETTGTPEGYKTVVTASYTLPAIAGGANLAVGRKFLSLPAGERVVTGSSMSMAIKQTQGNITADTPDVGIGTTIGSGAVAVLGGTAAFENILTGQTAADCNGTATVETVTTQLVIATADSHDLFFNVADGWAASGDTGALISGTMTIWWR